jgi:hypothetical protein
VMKSCRLIGLPRRETLSSYHIANERPGCVTAKFGRK